MARFGRDDDEVFDEASAEERGGNDEGGLRDG